MAFTSMSPKEPELKRYLGWATWPLLVGVTLSSFAFAYWYFVSAHDMREGQEVRQFSVTGEGKVAAKPDIAVFTATVVTLARKVGDAQSENTRRSNAVNEFLKSNGVLEKDMKTTGYSVYPQYQQYTYKEIPCLSGSLCPPIPRPQEIASYEVRNTLEIKVRNLDLVDDLLAGVVTSGANEVGSIDFTFDNPDALHAEARKKAIDDAKAKAEAIARDMGVRLKRITSFEESNGGVTPVYRYNAKMSAGVGGGREQAAPKVESGEQEIVSNVTITYEFR